MSFFISKEIENIVNHGELVAPNKFFIRKDNTILCEADLIGIEQNKIKLKISEINIQLIEYILQQDILFNIVYNQIVINAKFFAYEENKKNNYKQLTFIIGQD